jgi:hypothetical protein
LDEGRYLGSIRTIYRTLNQKNEVKEHSKRFKGIMPKPFPLPEAAWINKPDASQTMLL